MSEGHALHNPSGAKKRFACSGSLAMEANEPDDCNQYTDEGTAAHALASMCLSDGSHPAGYIGRVLEVVNGVYWPGVGTPRPAILKGQTKDIERKFTVDVEMAGKVNVYVQSVRQFAEGHELQVEQSVPIGHVSGEEGATGTSDAIVILSDFSELQSHDLKYGMGVEVSAIENDQGLYYLSGALEANRAMFEAIGEMPKTFRFVIHQPRLNHLSEWSCTYDELMVWQAKARKAEDLCRQDLQHRDAWVGKIYQGHLTPGNHCRSAFCKARASCPALAGFVQQVVQADFDVLISDTPQTVAARIPTDLKELGLKFAVLDIVADWVKQVRAKAEAALFEFNNSAEVQAALGLKIVQGKKGNRAWTNGEDAIALLKKMRLKTEEIYDLSVKSPPALEKQLADTPKRWQRIIDAKLIAQADGKPSVAPLDDKRPALDMTPKGDAFVVEPEGSDLC